MQRIVTLCGMMFAGAAAAHPGHGRGNDSGFGLLHYLSEPEHVTGVLIGVLAIAVVGFLLRRRARRP